MVGVAAWPGSWGPFRFKGPICENKCLATTLSSSGASGCLGLCEHTQGNFEAMDDISAPAYDRQDVWSLTHRGHSEIGPSLGPISMLPEKIRKAGRSEFQQKYSCELGHL